MDLTNGEKEEKNNKKNRVQQWSKQINFKRRPRRKRSFYQRREVQGEGARFSFARLTISLKGSKVNFKTYLLVKT